MSQDQQEFNKVYLVNITVLFYFTYMFNLTDTKDASVMDSHRQSQIVTDSHRQSQTVTDSHRQSHMINRQSQTRSMRTLQNLT